MSKTSEVDLSNHAERGCLKTAVPVLGGGKKSASFYPPQGIFEHESGIMEFSHDILGCDNKVIS